MLCLVYLERPTISETKRAGLVKHCADIAERFPGHSPCRLIFRNYTGRELEYGLPSVRYSPGLLDIFRLAVPGLIAYWKEPKDQSVN